MEEQNSEFNAAEAVKNAVFSEDKKRKRLHNEMCDYSDHLKFHSDGYTVPQVFYNRYDSLASAQVLNQWVPDMNTWQFGEPDKNIWFARLILARRPSEDLPIMFYRAMNYKAVTKTPISKVVNTLRKIEKANDFRVDWSKSEMPSSLGEQNSLEVYCEKEFPGYGSIQNYVFGYLLREVIARDPNLLIGIKPDDEDETPANELPKPYVFIYNVESQVYFKEGEIAIIKCDEKYYYNTEGGQREGNKYKVWTKNEIWEVYQDDKKFFVDEPPYVHNLGELPIWRPRGNVKCNHGLTAVNNSWIDDMLPFLDSAAGEYSDLQAEVVQHIFSTMWEYAGQNCSICNGTGTVQKNGNIVRCDKCEDGVMPSSPYKRAVIRPAKKNMGEQDVPTPPMGYVEKDVKIVELQDKRIQNHFLNALDAVSMRYLGESPLNQSGIAKRYDYEETFSFIYPISRFIVESILRKIYYFVNKIRYSGLITDVEKLNKMLPSIAIPAQFEVMTEQMIAEEIKTLRDGKIDPTIVAEKEMDYSFKAFRDDKIKLDKITLYKQLNPFPSLSTQEILDAELAGTITKSDAVKATYLPSFLEEAYQDDKEFYNKDYADKVKVIDRMVEEKVKELTASSAKAIIKANIDSASNTQGS